MEWHFDKRIVERSIQKGLVNPKDLEKRLKGLPDLADLIATADEHPEDEKGTAHKEE
jgi:hypothetical protein